MEVKQTSYGTRLDILFNLDPYSARPIMVSQAAAIPSLDNPLRLIVKAGTILDAGGRIANDAAARYVLLQDVDVTAGDAAGAGVYRGTLDLAKIEANTGVTISEDAQVALKGIIFMADASLDYVGGYTDDDASAIAVRVTALEGVVGDENAGLVSDFATLETVVGDENAGLVKDLADLDAIVTNETTGLVDIVTKETTGLVDRVEALEADEA